MLVLGCHGESVDTKGQEAGSKAGNTAANVQHRAHVLAPLDVREDLQEEGEEGGWWGERGGVLDKKSPYSTYLNLPLRSRTILHKTVPTRYFPNHPTYLHHPTSPPIPLIETETSVACLDWSLPHLPKEVDVSLHSVLELRASPWEHQLVPLHLHPVLRLLVCGKAGVRHVAEPDLG